MLVVAATRQKERNYSHSHLWTSKLEGRKKIADLTRSIYSYAKNWVVCDMVGIGHKREVGHLSPSSYDFTHTNGQWVQIVVVPALVRSDPPEWINFNWFTIHNESTNAKRPSAMNGQFRWEMVTGWPGVGLIDLSCVGWWDVDCPIEAIQLGNNRQITC